MARFLWATVLAIVFAPLYRRLSRSMRQRHNLAAFTTVVIIMVIVTLGGGPLHDASRAMPAMALALRRCRRGGADGNCTVRIQRDPIDAVALTNVQISI